MLLLQKKENVLFTLVANHSRPTPRSNISSLLQRLRPFWVKALDPEPVCTEG